MFQKGLGALLLLLLSHESNVLIQVVCALGVGGDLKLICNLQRANSTLCAALIPFSGCANICRPVEQLSLTPT